jgi:SAM-dependent methyltransferase
MSTIFSWKPEEFDDLLASCDVDPLLPFMEKHFAPGDKILEAGCGAARFVKYLDERGRFVCGLEYEPETLRQVGKKWPKLKLVAGDVQRMPFPDNCFRGMISVGVVEHFQEGPLGPLKDMLRTLEPGGVALITVPCLNHWRRLKGPFCGISHFLRVNSLIRRLMGRKPLPETGWNLRPGKHRWHVYPEWGGFFEYRFTPAQFLGFIREAGYEVVESRPIHQVDGLYHEFGRLFVRFHRWRFKMYPHGKALNWLLSRIPFFHNHMHLCVARKPVS